ncbi:hypothetical protein E4U09_000276 [Claviceps aff. purpurea]|uniref:Uncharacterized protein n=1 Tax=Claviceps aff. purpurea TaxID=1967640 RepID=A0A9P7QBJ6_9HYPO|nr:hypothetical protein E4U09_000276 [Claviceps aff. purpurea]
MQHVSGSDFVNPAIHFMAILGINPEHGTLREAQDYSYMLDGLVYCVRVISLELLLPPKNGDLRGIPEIHNFFVKRKKYLQDGSMGMIPCMISLLAYGKNYAMDYGNVGSVFWAEGNRVMVLHGARIVMNNFRAMPGIQVYRRDIAQTFEVEERREDATRRKTASTTGGGPFAPSRQVQEVASLLRGGQPARGTEVLSLRFKNGCDLGQELGTLQYRHAAVGIGRRFVGNDFAKDYYKDETGDVEEPEVATEDPLEMSAGRGSAAGARRYAV